MAIVIDVADTIDNPSALTQEQGNLIFEKISMAIDNKEKIELDFSNVQSIISPFLNNAIGQLYGKYKSEEIKQYLVLKNLPQNKISTLNIVINNAKKYYQNKDGFRKIAKDVLNVE